MKKKHPWYRCRGYIHFDLPLSLKTTEQLVCDPRYVGKHSFYPFISYEIISSKIKADPVTGNIERMEKKRGVSYASHLDSNIYSYYSTILSSKYESLLDKAGISNSVLAFRALGKSNIDFANNAFQAISTMGNCFVLCLDISGFFDRIDHQLLKKSWARVLSANALPEDHFNLYKSLTKHSSIEIGELYERLGVSRNNPKNGRKRLCTPDVFRNVIRPARMIQTNLNGYGIPQGSPISALLSNIYMFDFDVTIGKCIDDLNGFYYRYCDDMLFIVPLERASEVESVVGLEIAKLKLEVNDSKTEKREFRLSDGKQSSDKPVQYLGFTFDGQRKLIRSAAFARHSEQMKAGVRLAKLTKAKYDEIRAKKGLEDEDLYKKKIYKKYSHLGKRNFVRYALKSAGIMNSNSIRKQLKPLWSRLQDEIKK